MRRREYANAALDRPVARVLFVSYTARWKGPTISLLNLLRWIGPGLKPCVALPADGPFAQALGEEGIPYVVVPRLDKWSIPALCRVVKRGKFDLVYGNNVSSSSKNALIAAKLCRVPFVCHIREMYPGKQGYRRLFLRFADATVAVSRAAAASHAMFISGKTGYVVHNGVPIESLAPRSEARGRVVETVGKRPGTVLINVGTVCPRKGQASAVQALAAVRRRQPDVHLLLVGPHDSDRAYTHRLRNLVSTLGLEDHVSMVGFRRDVALLLRGADVYLHTARSDPHPRSVLEAMAAELPVVAYDVDGVSETVRQEVTGYVCTLDDERALAENLGRLIGDPAVRRAMGVEARKDVAQRFRADDAAWQITRIIERQVGIGPATRPGVGVA